MRAERLRTICRELETRGRVQVSDLVEKLGVKPVTVRRDLDALAEQDRLIRVRGGALRNERVRLEFSYADRLERHLAEKKAIAAKAATMVSNGQTVVLDTGSTTQLIARELSGREGLQIVTNSLAVGYELRAALGVTVILLGGRARPGGVELVGPFTERILGEIRADVAFLGADAVDAEHGFYATDPDVARVEQLMIQASAKVIVAASADKLSRRAFVRYAAFDDVDAWLTCGEVPNGVRHQVGKRLEMIVVPMKKGSAS